MDCPVCVSAIGLKDNDELRQYLSGSHQIDSAIAKSIANLVARVEELEKKQTS